nr:GAF domain-containing protein [candidate division Zixibacteria bacterium]
MEKKDENTLDYSSNLFLDSYHEEFEADTEKIKVPDTSDVLAEMEAALNEIAEDNPRIEADSITGNKASNDLKAVLQVSLAINSSLVLEDLLQIVMKKAIELLAAERGFIMLLDETDELQFKTAYNLCKETMADEDFRISNSIADEVAATGKSVYTSDALSDERFAKQQSVVELHLRSIMCVPLKIKSRVIGIIYLDNSSQAKLFLKSDLYLFEMLAQQAAHAIHNAMLYYQLLDLKKFNEKVINNSPVGVFVIDYRYNLVSINDAALAVLDKNRDGIELLNVGKTASNFFDLVPDKEIYKWQKMIDTAMETHEPFEEARYFHNTGYGEKVLSVKISPINKIPHGGDGLILVIEDITEKVIMEKYVILSEKLVARGEMAASIGHELNNYLAIIANNAELLSYNLEKERDDKARFNSQQIVENISKMKRFTDGLMDFSKLETEIIVYDIRRLIEELLFSLKAQSRFRQVEFSLDFDSKIPEIEIDVGQVQQVLLNLLNNAADAISEREKLEIQNGNHDFTKRISLKVKNDPADSSVKIMITDNGIGISEKNLSKIFQLHFTTKKTGHGLGLANCKTIIKNHQGDITLTSKEGEGTTFTILLPEKQLQAL